IVLFLTSGMIILTKIDGICYIDNYIVLGLGVESCGKFIASKERHTPTRIDALYMEYKAYIQGYITGLNMSTRKISNIVDGTDTHGAVSWIENYCKQNPVDHFDTAIRKLVLERLETIVERMKKGTRK